ncbi:MAG: redoxin family protein [Clostridium sp.]|uniref:cytochrome c biogenesis protein/redoxin n=1 Tax=Clostridium sp. TaxID=1506 RepID=UPI002A8CC204|nr:redoxin family protein [Clostridium sp.]MDY5096797.1 cytochrome c biogenesis protein/redoxin [Clostridium sp.]
MENINLFIVFVEGILSIFSPCILPILPIYLSMLSNSTIGDMQEAKFSSSLLMKNTIFFVLGISTTFFILGTSINALSAFFNTNKSLIMIIGGLIIIFMGLFYIGIIKSSLLSREKRFSMESKTMTPVSSFVLGFTFSFGWTPCIGPILASVLIMASSSRSPLTSNLLILIYTLGFILPFIIASLFYSKLFKKFDSIKKHMDTIKKVSGIIIIAAGVIMLINGLGGIRNMNNSASNNSSQNNVSTSSNEKKEETKKEEEKKIAAPDFTLYDQYGNKHSLSEYKGKTVFLNFWATWCPPCRGEMPDIEEIYKEYNENREDVIILGVASPDTPREGSKEEIADFLEEKGYTFPVVFGEKDSMLYKYSISSFPSTFIIDKEGYVKQYARGAMSKNTMKKLIESAR